MPSDGASDGGLFELTDRFEAESQVVSVRGDSLRVSPPLHTGQSDVDRLIGVMEAVLG